jgi:hypothetical protein
MLYKKNVTVMPHVKIMIHFVWFNKKQDATPGFSRAKKEGMETYQR